jgi:predicted TIM-barrel fold metal-dependent hydrolase
MMAMGEPQLQLECIRAYNDFQTEWSDLAPGRYLPMTTLPFWDLGATLKEMERGASAGHRGIVFSQEPAGFGLPSLTDRHWYPLWAAAQEMGLAVNFHVAATGVDTMDLFGSSDDGPHANFAAIGASFYMTTARTITQLIMSGICHRFPELNFVSVESGVGWLPFHLASLDWLWQNCGVAKEHPEYELLPSEYFRRQIYATFWFESASARFAIDQFADNILWETDFPHASSLSPGPASISPAPNVYLEATVGDLPEVTLRKVLHDNAARIYHLD